VGPPKAKMPLISVSGFFLLISAGLATVNRAWFYKHALSNAMGLAADHLLLPSQTLGGIKHGDPA